MATSLGEKPDQKSENKSQEHYDKEFNELTSLKHMARDGEEPSLYVRESKPDTDPGAPLQPWEQAKLDQVDAGLRDGDLYQPENQSTSNQPLKARLKGAFAGRRKYGWIGGGIAGAIIALIISFLPVLGPFQIFNGYSNHNFGLNDSYRRNRTGSIVKTLLNRNRTNRNLRDTPFKLKADLVDFEKFESRMQSRGWSFDYDTNGKAIGLIDPDGKPINLDNISKAEFNTKIQPLMDDTVPAWRFNKRVRTRSLISTFTGPRRGFKWTDLFKRDKTAEPEFEAAKFKKEAGIDEITVDADGKIRDIDADGVDLGSSSDGPGGEALQATVDAKLAGATDGEALKVGITELEKTSVPGDGAGKTSLIFGALIIGCISYSVNQNELLVHFERYAALLRHGAAFMLAVNEIQQGGNVDVGEVGQLFKEYNNYVPTQIQLNDENGNPVLDDNGNPIPYEDSTGTFAESASWQRASGKPVTGPELNNEFRLNQDDTPVAAGVLSGFIGALSAIGGSAANIPGFGLLCKALGSSIGFVVGLALDIVEGFGALLACLTGAGCVALGKFVIAELIFAGIGALISASLSSFAGFLTDNPVQAAGILDQSLNLISSEETRTATPVSSTDYNEELFAFEYEQNSRRPFWDRYFSLDNPRSLITALASSKMTIDKSDFRPVNIIATLLKFPGSSLMAIASNNQVYAADLDFDNYDIQKYSFNNNFLEVDAFDNAEDVIVKIEDDESIYLDTDNGKYARDFAVMCMGYDVDAGVVDKSSLNRSFLPVYSDPETFSNAQARNDAFNKICIEEATRQSGLYSQVGRFVDDMELIQSMGEISSFLP